jgi:hypothetical protein
LRSRLVRVVAPLVEENKALAKKVVELEDLLEDKEYEAMEEYE